MRRAVYCAMVISFLRRIMWDGPRGASTRGLPILMQKLGSWIV